VRAVRRSAVCTQHAFYATDRADGHGRACIGSSARYATLGDDRSAGPASHSDNRMLNARVTTCTLVYRPTSSPTRSSHTR
jgi:hypothetical protein